MADRPYDVVLFGATGFTGALTAAYLASVVPRAARWAVAGRNPAKLESLRERLATTTVVVPDVVVADVDDARSTRELAEQARVVATTVGPYVRYGEPLVRVCAEAGTDYADLTGEPEFVDRVYVEHHATAMRTGARLVHACGFDSVPADLGVYVTVQHLPEGVPIHVDGYMHTNGSFSAGTYHSAITAFARGRQLAEIATARRRLEPRPPGRRVRAKGGRPHRTHTGYAVPVPVIDPQIVARSARALPRYGPDFTYRHHAVVRRLPALAAGLAAVGGAVALAQLPPARRILLDRFEPGEGPSPQRRARSWFRLRLIGRGGGREVVTEVSGGDPGYDETAKMLSEVALSLAFDDNPEVRGQTTTAAALGDNLVRRITAAGISIESR